MKALLVIALIVDFALAALLIAVSGFIFGSHEGMAGDPVVATGWIAMIVLSIGAPIAGFMLARRTKPWALVVAWLPPVIAAIAASIPPRY